MKNAKHIQIAPGIYLHFLNQLKNQSVFILLPKIFSQKYTFFEPKSIPGPQPDTVSYGQLFLYPYFANVCPFVKKKFSKTAGKHIIAL